jgi:hypothetical protein
VSATSKPPFGSPGWWERERESVRQFSDRASERGPLWTLGHEWGNYEASWVIRTSLGLGLVAAAARSRIGSYVLAGVITALAIVLPIGGTTLALNSGELFWQVFVGVFIGVYAIFASLVLFQISLKRTRATFAAHFSRWEPPDIVWFGAAVAVLPAAGFASATALLVAHGVLPVQGVPPNDPWLTLYTFEAFVWTFVDTIPILEIPQTLGWTPQLVFASTAGGVLVLAFKIVELLPITQLLAGLLKTIFGEPDEVKGAEGLARTRN